MAVSTLRDGGKIPGVDRSARTEIPVSTAGRFSVGYLVGASLLLILFSVVAVISAAGTYRISIEGSRNLLETRAVDIAVNLGFTLERLGLREELFPELLRTARWDDLAFLALYDRHGAVVLHSNPRLVGRDQRDKYLQKVVEEERPVIHFSMLGTGEEVFVLDFPLHLHRTVVRETPVNEPAEPEGLILGAVKPVGVTKFYCLRVAVHPYPAQEIVRRADLQLIVIGISLAILWGLTFFLLWSWARYHRLAGRLQEQERMAALGEMAAVLAHEIRNPLSSIKGFAQYHLEAPETGNLRDDLTVIVEESRRLERLTTNLLTYARPAKPNEEEFEVTQFCKELEKSLGVPGAWMSIEVDCDTVKLRMDRGKLMQIVLNLVQNALEAVRDREDGRVWLRIGSREGQVMVTVEDNGPGLPEEVKRRMFEPFVTTKAQGTGLGLAIVSRLVAALGGTVRFADRGGGGTAAVVALPSGQSPDVGLHEEPR